MNLPILPSGEKLLPPSGRKYSKQQIQLLGQCYPAKNVVKIIDQSEFGPSARQIYRHLKGVSVQASAVPSSMLQLMLNNPKDSDNDEELIVIESATSHISPPAVSDCPQTISPAPGLFGIEMTSSRKRQKHTSHDFDVDLISKDVIKYIRNKLTSTMSESRGGSLQSLTEQVLSRALSTCGSKAEFIRVPPPRPFRPSSDTARQQFIRRKSNTVNNFLSKLLPSDNGIIDAVLRTVTADQNCSVTDDDLTLKIEELVTICDVVGPTMGTNAMYRFASAYEALRPGRKIFPSCIKMLFAEFEGANNLSITTENHLLIVSKEGMATKMLAHMCVNELWELAALIKEKSKLDGSYDNSEDFMKETHKSKDCFTFNLDKSGSNMNGSIRLANRSEGNSSRHTYPIIMTEGPYCK